jgi:transposase
MVTPIKKDMKRDGRTFDHKTLEEIRFMAVERVREGERPAAVAASYGFHRATIYKWLKAARRLGWGRRPCGRHGRAVGPSD